MSEPTSAGGAFFKGGCGCVLVFAVVAFLAVMVGGNAHIDILGLIALFLVGGVVGLIVRSIYNRGRRDGGGG